MDNLDQPQSFGELDKENMLGHIMELPEQIDQAWNGLQNLIIPALYIKVKNVVILGLGGSGIGGNLAKFLTITSAKLPIEIVGDYTLPNHVSSDSLVIAVSYSGETEETLSAFKEASKKGAKLLVVTTGGELASLASRVKAPIYKINYGSPPRAALGYSFMAVLGVLHKLGLVELGRDDVKEAIVLMQGLRAKLSAEVPTYQNDAKKMAQRIGQKIPIVIGGGLLSPVAYRWMTQFNENAKHLSFTLVMPELCHNWINAMKFPQEVKAGLLVIVLQSKFDHPRNRLRQNVLAQIMRKNGLEHEFVFVHPSGNRLSEQLMTLYLGDFISYYLSLLNGVDPTPVDEVVYLKKQLENSSIEG